jgi:[acyl-carrier-protein] S-malonyltransferase
VMADALATARFQAPLVPLYANVTAGPVTDPATIVALLVEQVTATVRWRESVEAMVGAGVTQFVEFGGRVLGPMIRRITPEAPTRSLITMDDIEALLKEI